MSPENDQSHDPQEVVDREPGWYCGAETRSGGTCHLRAGHGTDHPGIGTCKLHLGSTRNHRQHAAIVRARRFAEVSMVDRQDRPIGHTEALLEELARCAGWVDFLSGLVATLDVDDLKQLDMSGKFEKPSVWFEMLGNERDRLRSVAKDCATVGVEARYVALAEQLAGMFSAAQRSVFDAPELALTDAQRAVLPGLVRSAMATMRAIDATSRDTASPAAS